MYNLRNRGFMKEIDFEPGELRHLLQLSDALEEPSTLIAIFVVLLIGLDVGWKRTRGARPVTS
jgi:hypothetical protein